MTMKIIALAEGFSGVRLELTVAEDQNNIWVWGAFGDDQMTMDSNAHVDSYDASLGTFRMNKDHLKTIQKQRTDSSILHYPFAERDGSGVYPTAVQDELLETVGNRLRELAPDLKVNCFTT